MMVFSWNTRVQYDTIDHAIQLIKKATQGYFMVKLTKDAFRIILISSEDYALLGMQWQVSYYYDIGVCQKLFFVVFNL